jgi:GNAT superfamily N-acetyltransferase
MTIQARPYYDTTDLDRMRQLLMAGMQSGVPASYMHPGMLDWMTHYPPDEEANRRDILLWEGAGEASPTLAAWAIFARHEGTFDLFVRHAVHGSPLQERIVDEYVAWAAERARAVGLSHIRSFWALDYDTVLERLLLARGFVVLDDLPLPLFERTLDNLPDVRLPSGFSVRGVQDREDGRRRAQVTYAAFRSDADWDGYWADYAQLIGSAVYDGERDLLVTAPDGRGAAACTIWFDAVNVVGLFEPVATHPDFQGRGLGKAVMAEGMRRMKAAGMKRAVLGFDPHNVAARALYTALGFSAVCHFVLYSKDVTALTSPPPPE